MSIAYWCVLVAAILPYATVGIAKARSPYDNATPRATEAYNGLASRAYGAHLNGFEVFPFFAVAVLVASAGAPKATSHLLDALALTWIALRLVYTAFYFGGHATLRSLAWLAGFIVTVVLFTMPAWHG